MINTINLIDDLMLLDGIVLVKNDNEYCFIYDNGDCYYTVGTEWNEGFYPLFEDEIKDCIVILDIKIIKEQIVKLFSYDWILKKIKDISGLYKLINNLQYSKNLMLLRENKKELLKL